MSRGIREQAVRVVRIVTATLLIGGGAVDALAQTPPLVFTAPLPAAGAPVADVRVTPVIGERALGLWTSGGDFGVGVDLAHAGSRIRATASMLTLRIDGQTRSTFQQIEFIPTLLRAGSTTLAAGGGIREEWGGGQTLIARALAAADIGGGRVEGSLVIEHAVSAIGRRDAADMVTTAGWARRIGQRVAIGIEGIGQDLEGFWDPSETEGGARLLAGPSLHLRSANGAWSASATVGPVFRSASRSVADSGAAGHHFGVFASATWLPARRR